MGCLLSVPAATNVSQSLTKFWWNFQENYGKALFFCFVGVCVLCVCVCSVCLCWGGFPCWTPGTKHLASLALHQILVTRNLKKNGVRRRSISILIYLCQFIKACNPTHATWSICSCEFATLHSRQLWPNHNFLFQGVDHTKYQFAIRSHEASWCDLFSFVCMPLVKQQPLFLS